MTADLQPYLTVPPEYLVWSISNERIVCRARAWCHGKSRTLRLLARLELILPAPAHDTTLHSKADSRNPSEKQPLALFIVLSAPGKTPPAVTW